MPRIAIPKREDAPAESKPILDNVDKMLGFVPNLHRLMSISPNALSGWATLMGSLAKTLDVKTRDGIALAVSEATPSMMRAARPRCSAPGVIAGSA